MAKDGVKRPDPTDTFVGQQIRAQRNIRGWSQSKLADALGLTFQQVQKYEKGVNRVGAGRLVKIAEILDTTVAALTGTEGGNGKKPASNALTRLAQTHQGVALAEAYTAIKDSDMRAGILKTAEAAAKAA
jgi:transcriptional regulator with XRE-family HTH domain